ncbi:E3 ubiquitin-protein ligase WAV3-like [Henckelia pumila]|uniref:E3 ubiquitin-protein ligase WAV3-like n=1 Tax=Henckelia pumila TaxID=405737 RepID=UPI003C6E045B
MGVKVLKNRGQQNPVASIVLLSDGRQSYQFFNSSSERWEPVHLQLTPLPRNMPRWDLGTDYLGQQKTFPVHSFGFGTDHEPVAMHVVADLSGGTFSFIESCEKLQDAFASGIGGILSMVTQDLRLSVRPTLLGVEIKSIHSGGFATETSKSQGILNIGDLYADEEKEFLINLSIPSLPNDHRNQATEPKMPLLDITCTYTDVASKERVEIEGYLVDIHRPRSISPQDMVLSLEVDRQKNCLSVLRIIAQAQQMAETGNLTDAQAVLSKGRSNLLGTSSAQAGDTLCMWLDAEMEETRKRMVNEALYLQRGRAYALSEMSSLTCQRASSRGNTVAGAEAFGSGFSFIGAGKSSVFGAYVTPNMAYMVSKSQKLSK